MKPVLLPSALLLACAAMPAQANEELYREKGCMACHAPDKRVVGPAYSEVARKYRPMPDGEQRIVDSILNGSAKKWGPIRMYPNLVTKEEAQQLAAWILTL
ncbi:MAG TPA: c-type cytochrome [Usitatibacter sp.]|nr:c-type cytochrome [Usitatibacter sp.]